MGTPYSGAYPTGDPNKTPEEMDAEAGLAYARWSRGQATVSQLASEMGISRRTFYNRLKLISAHSLPSRDLARAVELDRLEHVTLRIVDRLEGDCTDPDFARLAGEFRQYSAARRQLLKLDDAPTDPDEALEEEQDAPDWEAGE